MRSPDTNNSTPNGRNVSQRGLDNLPRRLVPMDQLTFNVTQPRILSLDELKYPNVQVGELGSTYNCYKLSQDLEVADLATKILNPNIAFTIKWPVSDQQLHFQGCSCFQITYLQMDKWYTYWIEKSERKALDEESNI